MRKSYKQYLAAALIATLSFSNAAFGQAINPGQPAQAGVGLSQAGSTLNVIYGSTAGTAKQGNAISTVAQGGTGLGTLTANSVLLGNGTGNIAFVGPSATSGQVLTSTGASTAPTFQTPTSAIITSVFGQTGAIPNLSGDATTSGSSAVTLANTSAARTNIGLGTANNVTFSTINGSTITGTALVGGTVAGTTGTFSGAVSGTTGTYTGAITGAGYSGGPLSGTTGTYTGAITGAGYSGGPISGTTLASSGLYTASAAINTASAVTLASASTVNIGAAASNNITISGTTTITAFDTVAAGVTRTLKFSGILTLTYNSSSLILPGSKNITTAIGDVVTVRSLGGGNWECLDYQSIGSGGLQHGAAFKAHIVGSTALSPSTFTKVQINTTDFDTGGYFNTSLNRFLPTVPGYYQINVSLSLSSSNPQNVSLYLYKNGVSYTQLNYVPISTGFIWVLSGSDVVLANGTDYFEVYGWCDGASGCTAAANSNFSGALIRSN